MHCPRGIVAQAQWISLDRNDRILAETDPDPNPTWYPPPVGTPDYVVLRTLCG